MAPRLALHVIGQTVEHRSCSLLDDGGALQKGRGTFTKIVGHRAKPRWRDERFERSIGNVDAVDQGRFVVDDSLFERVEQLGPAVGAHEGDGAPAAPEAAL